MLRFLTAGESHGPGLLAIVEGIPAGLKIKADEIDRELARRKQGHGRGGRMDIEKDKVEILSGIRHGKTIGTPISLHIRNLDWKNWRDVMAIEKSVKKHAKLTRPRPGHADFAGYLKYGFDDIRNVIERASARETAVRVAVGAIAKLLLEEFNVSVLSNVISIGEVETEKLIEGVSDKRKTDNSKVRTIDGKAGRKMMEEIDKAAEQGETLGGLFEVVVFGVIPGLGNYTQWDKRLDGNLARALMSIPAIKGVQIGEGYKLAGVYGSQAHDELLYSGDNGFFRKTNKAGGLEGGVTNGEPVCMTIAMKPIPTLGRPLKTVDLKTKKEAKAQKERADVCAVPSAAVIGESVVAIEIANTYLEKFGGDSIAETKRSHKAYVEALPS